MCKHIRSMHYETNVPSFWEEKAFSQVEVNPFGKKHSSIVCFNHLFWFEEKFLPFHSCKEQTVRKSQSPRNPLLNSVSYHVQSCRIHCFQTLRQIVKGDCVLSRVMLSVVHRFIPLDILNHLLKILAGGTSLYNVCM